MKNDARILGVFLIVPILLLAVCAAAILLNARNATYASLNEVDRKLLTEIERCADREKESAFFADYRLSDKTIVALDKDHWYAYLINPETPVRSVFARQIHMPAEYDIRVYRVAAAAPQLLQFRGIGNFNTIGKQYTIWGSNAYYIKYNRDMLLGPDFDSHHFITLLSHEAFHYYMQNDWKDGGRFRTDNLSETDMDLLEELYEVIEQLQQELLKSSVDQARLRDLCQKYVAVMEKRIAANPTYVEQELFAETAEGTATYVGIRASQAVGYPFDVMCFEQDGTRAEHLPFTTLIPAIRSGAMSPSTLASDWVYQTGGLLCKLLDACGVPDWQEKLNRQTVDAPVTLYGLVKAYAAE